jgi:Na+/H+-dicarboxylate symporter
MLKKTINTIMGILKYKWTIPIVFVISLLLNNCSEAFVQQAWSLAIFAKQIIELALPLIIFSLIASGLISLGSSGGKVVIVALLATFATNFLFFWTLYPISTTKVFTTGAALSDAIAGQSICLYDPAWTLAIGKIITTEQAIILAISTWIILTLFFKNKANIIGPFLAKLARALMQNLFAPIIPLFLFGFAVNVNFAFIVPIFKAYSHIILLVSAIQYGILFSILFLAEGKIIFSQIRYMIPAWIIGFTTMSSGMAMPEIINGLEKIGIKRSFAAPIISIIGSPFTWGDIFMMPALFIISINVFGYSAIDLQTYLSCAIYFAILKHSCCCVAGGAAIALMPIMENTLGFSSEMCMFVTSLTIMVDCFTTASNVTGHFAMPIMLSKIFKSAARE